MICGQCGKKFDEREERCPHCGQPRAAGGSGVFQTSTVLISARGADLVYRSVDEIPAPLRTKLLQSTNSANSGTILIADRRGRKEIAKAMRNLPGAAQRRLHGEGAPGWLTPLRKRIISGAILALVSVLVAFLFRLGH